jgi:outer membrane immunogenic protein
MFSRVIVIAASVAAAAAQVQAADVYSPPVGGYSGYKDAYVPGPTWNGFYLGFNGGYGWKADNARVRAYAHDDSGGGAGVDGFATRTFEQSGGFGGGQIGFNFARSGFLVGAETDIQAADLSGSRRVVASATDITTTTTTVLAKDRLDYFATVRGRVGYALDRALVYFTGGFAFGGADDQLRTGITDGVNNYSHTVKNAETLTGYVLGGGFEYAMSPAWSLKAEYQYMDLGRVTLTDSRDLTATSTGASALAVDHSYQTIRLGLNYRVQQEYAPLK